jgi:hypothetical protein
MHPDGPKVQRAVFLSLLTLMLYCAAPESGAIAAEHPTRPAEDALHDFPEFLGTCIFAVFVAIVALGSGNDQSRRLLTQLEKEYAKDRRLPWRAIRPILRSNTSADEKLTAIGELIGTVELDTELYPLFEKADATLGRLERSYRYRYYGLVGYVMLLLALIVVGWWIGNASVLKVGPACFRPKQFLTAVALLPVCGFLGLFIRIAVHESKFSDLYSSVEENL